LQNNYASSALRQTDYLCAATDKSSTLSNWLGLVRGVEQRAVSSIEA